MKKPLWQNEETKARKQGSTAGRRQRVLLCFLLEKPQSDRTSLQRQNPEPLTWLRKIVVLGKCSEKHGRRFNQQFRVKPFKTSTEELPVKRQSVDKPSWKASLTCACDQDHWQPLLFSLACPDSEHTGHRVLESHRGAPDWNIHLGRHCCKDGSLTLSPMETLVRTLLFSSRWTESFSSGSCLPSQKNRKKSRR